jgi:hypothetical protein
MELRTRFAAVGLTLTATSAAIMGFVVGFSLLRANGAPESGPAFAYYGGDWPAMLTVATVMSVLLFCVGAAVLWHRAVIIVLITGASVIGLSIVVGLSTFAVVSSASGALVAIQRYPQVTFGFEWGLSALLFSLLTMSSRRQLERQYGADLPGSRARPPERPSDG